MSNIFSPAVGYAVGTIPWGCVATDLNKDGFPDIINTNEGSGTVTVLLGKGDGTLNAPISYACAGGPKAIIAADFNLDGNIDIATVNKISNNIAVLLGNGKGALGAASYYSAGTHPHHLTVADFNNDDIPDIVNTNAGSGSGNDATITLFLGKGDGNFEGATTYNIGANWALGISTADLNDDGSIDVLTVSSFSDKFNVFLGSNSTLSSPTSYNTATHPQDIKIADLNYDGKLDVVVSLEGTTNNIALFPGDGVGGFGNPSYYTAYSTGRARGLALVDVNFDGLLDIVATTGSVASDSDGRSSGNVAVLLGDKESLFKESQSYTVPEMPFLQIAVADLNLDNRPDLIFTHFRVSGLVSVMLNKFPLPNTTTTTAISEVTTQPSFIKNGVFELSSLEGNPGLGFTINGVNEYDRVGRQVSSAGDVNGDGIDDLMFSDLYAKHNEIVDTGKIYVVFGKNYSAPLDITSIDGSNGFIIVGEARSDVAGASIASAGDLNGDDRDDIIIGAPGADISAADGQGRVYVIFGRSSFSKFFDLSSLDGSNGFIVNGLHPLDRLGFAVAGLGDVNGDGKPDIAMGAYTADPGGEQDAGQVYVIFGREHYSKSLEINSLSGINGFIINGINKEDFISRGNPKSISSAGDVNGDGKMDIFIGANYADPGGKDRAGQAYVIFGRSNYPKFFYLSSLNGTNGFMINGRHQGDALAKIVSVAGDVNGDGISDIIVSATGFDPDVTRTEAGETYVIFGKYNHSSPVELASLDDTNGFIIRGVKSRDYSGRSIASAGDINQDGMSDIMIGAATNPEQVYIVFGTRTPVALLELSSIDGENGIIVRGASYSIALGGDFNSDGRKDLIIGTAGVDLNGKEDVGKVDVLYSSTLFPEATTTTTTAISEVTTQPSFIKNGVFELSMLESNPQLGFTINGINAGDWAGRSISSAGDINGDGFEDILIGADSARVGGKELGQAYVVFGRNRYPEVIELNDLDGSNGFIMNGLGIFDHFGLPVRSIGDINQDGLDDIIISSNEADPNNQANAGQVYVVFGSDTYPRIFDLTLLNGTNGFMINGIKNDDRLGASVASAGDVNGDGVPDITISASGADQGIDNDAGQVYVVFGKKTYSKYFDLTSLNADDGFVINGENYQDNLGRDLSFAGDMNGDGLGDIIIGTRDHVTKAYVVFGQKTQASIDVTSLNGENGFVIDGSGKGDKIGWPVASAGDINGDGIPDIMTSYPGATNRTGKVYVIFGQQSYNGTIKTALLDGDNGFIINGIHPGDRVGGWSIYPAGDLNRDGIDDILIGGIYADPGSRESAGQVYIVFGREKFNKTLELSALDGTNGLIINGANNLGNLGVATATLQDVDGDGIQEIMVAAHQATPPTGARDKAGQVYIIYSSALFPETTTTSTSSILITSSTSSLTSVSSTVTTISSSVSTITETSTSTTLKSSPSATSNTAIVATNLPTTEGQIETTKMEEDPDSSDSSGVIWGVVLSVIAVVGIAGFLLWRYKNNAEVYTNNDQHDNTIYQNPLYKEKHNQVSNDQDYYEPYAPKQQQSQETPQIDMDGYVVDDNTEQAYTGLSGNTQHYDTNA